MLWLNTSIGDTRFGVNQFIPLKKYFSGAVVKDAVSEKNSLLFYFILLCNNLFIHLLLLLLLLLVLLLLSLLLLLILLFAFAFTCIK